MPEQVRAELGLDIPAELLNTLPTVVSEPEPTGPAEIVAGDPGRQGFLTGDEHWLGGQAIELDSSDRGSPEIGVANVPEPMRRPLIVAMR